jgi:uncharacterized protein YecT (DUF1311 family)
MTSQFLRLFLVILFACLIAAPAATTQTDTSPQDDIVSQEYDRCIDASEGITSNVLDCGGEELDRLDVILNQTYRALMQKLPPTRQRQLRDSERKWITWRERDCLCYSYLSDNYDDTGNSPLKKFEQLKRQCVSKSASAINAQYGLTSGTLANVMYQTCFVEKMEQRIIWLRQYPRQK